MCHMPEPTATSPLDRSTMLTAKGEAYILAMRLRSSLTHLDPTDRLEVVSEIEAMCRRVKAAA